MKTITFLLIAILLNFSLTAQDGIYLFGILNNFPGEEMEVDVTIYTDPLVTTTLTTEADGDIPTTWIDLPSAEWNYLEASFVDCNDSITTVSLSEDSTNGLIDVFIELDYCEGGAVYGCTLFNADNYNPAATIDNGSCYFSDCETIFQTFTETCALVQFIAFPPNYSYTWTLNGEPYDATDGWIYFYPEEPGTYEFCAQRNYLGCEDAVYCKTFVIEECEIECAEIALDVEYNIGDNGCAIYVTADGDQAESDVWDMGDGSDLIYYGGEMGIYHEYDSNGAYIVCADFYYEDCVSQSCKVVIIDDCTPLAGCTDPEATNYNPQASIDDDSCEFIEDCETNHIRVQMSPGSWNNEVLWNIVQNEAVIVGGGVSLPSSSNIHWTCLEDGCYTFELLDTYGDGWNGAAFTILDEDNNILASGTLPLGSYATVEFGVNVNCSDATIYGCTDPEAVNYNPVATVDDGSCEYDFECSISFTVSPDTTGAQTIWITPSINIIEATEVEWDFGDGTSSSDLYPSHTYEGDGPYTLCLTAFFENPDGGFCEITHCAELSDEMINPPGIQQNGFSINVVDPFGTTGINDQHSAFGHLTVAPNPGTNISILHFNLSEQKEVTIEMFSVTGKVVLQRTINGMAGNNTYDLPISDLSRGIYLIRLSAADHQINTRLLKQ